MLLVAQAGTASASPTDITLTLDPHSHGRVFEGVSTLSAIATSILLSQYPESISDDILDFHFEPGFGASFQHLRIKSARG